jgi:ketosteroid isomerase-like protein
MDPSIESGPMMAVRAFVAAFNAREVDDAQAAWVDGGVIIDDFPPHEWTGRHVAAAWLGDIVRLSREFGMSHASVTIQEGAQVIVTDRQAYGVVPIDVSWRQDGVPQQRRGSMTLAFRDESDGWRISACAWTWN